MRIMALVYCAIPIGGAIANPAPATAKIEVVYQEARLFRLIKLCTIEPSKAVFTMLRLADASNDIGSELKIGVTRVVRICSFGEVGYIRVFKARPDGSCVVRITDKKGASILVQLPPETYSKYIAKVDHILENPVSFERQPSHQSSNGSNYIVESIDREVYRWAIRPVDETNSEDYEEIVSLIEMMAPIERKSWETLHAHTAAPLGN